MVPGIAMGDFRESGCSIETQEYPDADLWITSQLLTCLIQYRSCVISLPAICSSEVCSAHMALGTFCMQMRTLVLRYLHFIEIPVIPLVIHWLYGRFSGFLVPKVPYRRHIGLVSDTARSAIEDIPCVDRGLHVLTRMNRYDNALSLSKGPVVSEASRL